MALHGSLCKQTLAVQNSGLPCNSAPAAGALGTGSDVAWATTSSTLHRGLGCQHLINQAYDQVIAACEQTGQQARLDSCPDSTATTIYL